MRGRGHNGSPATTSQFIFKQHQATILNAMQKKAPSATFTSVAARGGHASVTNCARANGRELLSLTIALQPMMLTGLKFLPPDLNQILEMNSTYGHFFCHCFSSQTTSEKEVLMQKK